MACSAGNFGFQSYTGGIISNLGVSDDRLQCFNDGRLDHAVLCFGYEDYLTEDDELRTAVLCKNSWGTRWGDNGYMRIDQDACGITYDFAIAKTTKPAVSNKE